MRRLKNLVVNLGITITAFVFAVIVAEIGLRVARIEYLPPGRDEESESNSLYITKDQNRGWAGNPNATAFWTGEGIPSELKVNRADSAIASAQKQNQKMAYELLY